MNLLIHPEFWKDVLINFCDLTEQAADERIRTVKDEISELPKGNNPVVKAKKPKR